MRRITGRWQKAAVTLMTLFVTGCLYAQSVLDKPVSISVKERRLEEVLKLLAKEGQCFFSYNSNLVPQDSIVSINATKQPLRSILTSLLGDNYEFKANEQYIIIRLAPAPQNSRDKYYVVQGYVLDGETGEQLNHASVYEKRLLVSTLTNEEGYFKLRLKTHDAIAFITISKEWYNDTTIQVKPGVDKQVNISVSAPSLHRRLLTIGPDGLSLPDSINITVESDSAITQYLYVKADSVKVEKTMLAKLFLSPGQKIQSLNLKKFFTERPFQVSLVPGLGTHGSMSGQVINHASFNLLGGYTGGLKGVEAAGLFNIDRKDVSFLQAAGVANVVGGRVTGLQVAGVTNTVLDSVKGVQAAGITNLVRGKFKGLQAAGIYNHAGDSMRGAQAAGTANLAWRDFTGLQVAGAVNVALHDLKGLQVAGAVNASNGVVKGVQLTGVVNYAKLLKGVQIGLVNVADSSAGVSLGLINIVIKGYHKLSLYTDEVAEINGAFKTGNRKLYNILLAGYNFSSSSEHQLFTYGYGLGSEWPMGKQKRWSLTPELTAQYLYLGSWDYTNILSKLHLGVNFQISKLLAITTGPSLAVYYSNQSAPVHGYRYDMSVKGLGSFDFGSQVKGWIGWRLGVNLF